MIEKLSEGSSEEDNMNANAVLLDVIEIKEFYHMICTRDNVLKVIDIAFPEVSNPSSQNAALGVLNQFVVLFNDMKKSFGKKKEDEEEDSTL